MYAYLWRILPGPIVVKVLLAMLLFLGSRRSCSSGCSPP